MLRPAKRGRARYGAHLCCAAAAIFLLLLSISVLHSRLSSSHTSSQFLHGPRDGANDVGILPDDGDDNDALDDDRIDALDVVEEADEGEEDDEVDDEETDTAVISRSGGYFWDHALGVRRRSFGGGSRGRRGQATDRQDDLLSVGSRRGVSFASDDQPVEEDIRLKLASIRSIEDALLLKVGSSGSGGRRTPSLLREGWAPWFEAKGRYLRQDRMFGSGMEKVDPKIHPLLQDPDAGAFPVGLTRGDRLLQKAMWKELEKTPFLGEVHRTKKPERKALGTEKQLVLENNIARAVTVSELKEEPRYPDERHWGYYPGLEEHSSFSEFVDRFLNSGRCSISVFMIWNSPPWAYSVRHQRGLESLLHHHRDACVLMFTETMELNFFKDFVKDGYFPVKHSTYSIISFMSMILRTCEVEFFGDLIRVYFFD